jgi:hypothetical protein
MPYPALQSSLRSALQFGFSHTGLPEANTRALPNRRRAQLPRLTFMMEWRGSYARRDKRPLRVVSHTGRSQTCVDRSHSFSENGLIPREVVLRRAGAMRRGNGAASGRVCGNRRSPVSNLPGGDRPLGGPLSIATAKQSRLNRFTSCSNAAFVVSIGPHHNFRPFSSVTYA